MVIRRGGRELTVNVEIADLPEVSAPKVAVLQELELVTLTPAIRAERGIRVGARRGGVQCERPCFVRHWHSDVAT